jgi:hypothetical protein
MSEARISSRGRCRQRSRGPRSQFDSVQSILLLSVVAGLGPLDNGPIGVAAYALVGAWLVIANAILMSVGLLRTAGLARHRDRDHAGRLVPSSARRRLSDIDGSRGPRVGSSTHDRCIDARATFFPLYAV